MAVVIRYSGQKILYSLMMHEDFERMMTRYVPPDKLESISDKLETLKRRVTTSLPDFLIIQDNTNSIFQCATCIRSRPRPHYIVSSVPELSTK